MQSDPQKQAQALLQDLRARLEAAADPKVAEPMARYMKNQFGFFGIKTPERQAIVRAWVGERGMPGLPVVKALFRLCFQAEERELQYVVNDLGRRLVKRMDESFLDLVHELIAQRSWWDSVDFLAPKLAGPLLWRFSHRLDAFPDRWIESPNRWYQRSAILYQLDYKERTDPDRLFGYIRRRADSREFFVQKGAGWALRQYSKVEPEAVRTFIGQHDLPALTRREGLKWLQRQA